MLVTSKPVVIVLVLLALSILVLLFIYILLMMFVYKAGPACTHNGVPNYNTAADCTPICADAPTAFNNDISYYFW